MADWAPRLSQQAELDRIEGLLAAGPTLELLFERAALWQALGRLEEAKTAYLEILKQDSNHMGALSHLGALLHETNFRSAAITVYKRILSLRPRDSAAHVNLAHVLWDHNDHPGARRQYEAALEIDPNQAEAHQGMAAVMSELREGKAAFEHGKKGYQCRPLMRIPYRGVEPPLELLVLGSAAGGNIPLSRAIDDRIFMTTMLVTEFFDPAAALPPHHLVWNAIGDADYRLDALHLAADLLKKTRAPVINPPQIVAKTGRADNARRLAGIAGLRVPKIAVLRRESLEGADAPARIESLGFGFPLLLRAQGFHAGMHFVKLESPLELPESLALMPGQEFAVQEFLDARGADGKMCKYRVMMVDGGLYPLHAAISADWKIHYFSADMRDNAHHRALDEAFLLDMPAVLGPAAMAVLGKVRTTLGLDYAGIDFSVDASGEVLFFEANATMVIAPPDAGAQWDYRRAPVKKVLDAVTAMLRSRIRAAS
ncbi:MAG TPA: tetratricopeptide repeat protein [bacterium]|nr:tetratricopeptide repeat protein [bacterium]